MGGERATSEENRGTEDRGLKPLGQRWEKAEPRLSRVTSKAREYKPRSKAVFNTVYQMNTLPLDERISFFQRLSRNKPEIHSEILSAIREGRFESVRMPVAIQLISMTPWASTDQGKKVRKQLAWMYANQRISFGKEVYIGNAITVPDNVNNISNLRGTASSTILNEESLGISPEGAAAIAAHEGLHAYRMSEGIVDNRLLQSETDAEMVASAVWSAFGKEKKNTVSLIVYQLDETAENYDPDSPDDDFSMRIHVATMYSYNFAKGGKVYELDKAARIVEDLLRQDAERTIGLFSDSQLKRIFYAYNKFLGNNKTAKARSSRRIWKRLYDEMESRKLWKSG